MDRGQLPMTVIEAGLGVLLLVAVTFTFAFGVAPPDTSQAQLDTYAADAATLLANEPARHADQTRVDELLASADAFDREKDDLERRIERILPENVLFHVETEYGTAGHPLPDDAPTGTATITSRNGELTLRVWYV